MTEEQEKPKGKLTLGLGGGARPRTPGGSKTVTVEVRKKRVISKPGEKPQTEQEKLAKRANEIEAMTLIGDVTNQDIVLIDDICDTAGTLAKAAGLIMERGARSVRAVCTHPVLSGKAYETIENSVLAELIVTDTIPLKYQSSKIRVLSTAELFAKAIMNVNEHGSISQLFKVD